MSYNFFIQFLLYVRCIFNNTENPFCVWPWVDGIEYRMDMQGSCIICTILEMSKTTKKTKSNYCKIEYSLVKSVILFIHFPLVFYVVCMCKSFRFLVSKTIRLEISQPVHPKCTNEATYVSFWWYQ
jgi:hypothetical protein